MKRISNEIFFNSNFLCCGVKSGYLKKRRADHVACIRKQEIQVELKREHLLDLVKDRRVMLKLILLLYCVDLRV
jgi:hypothetical protein